ncbi:uncharacterized protein MONOS_18656 [Monocercomonoides exilis]|uniref:uncharacterized protein n=1 Tax=Monocercomonoides exilis TaxID=2049356 RepID=UPI00355AA0FA|nr:hypothetical protein MONOS_18656 [Monocercomonoides exilis]
MDTHNVELSKNIDVNSLENCSIKDKQSISKTISSFEGKCYSSSEPVSNCKLGFYRNKPEHLTLQNKRIEFEISIAQAPDAFIEVVSQQICILFAVILPKLIYTKRHFSSGKEKIIIELSEEGLKTYDKVQHFYKFIRDETKLTTVELVHTFVLMEHLMRIESKEQSEGRPTMIAESNLGTLLLCVVMIAIKLNRDIPFRNGWWATMLKVPLDVLNQSELIFLERVKFCTHMEESEYVYLLNKFTSVFQIQHCELKLK